MKFTGIVAYDHLFDFVIPKSRRRRNVSSGRSTGPSRATAETFIHVWSDTREVRSRESQAHAIMNDSEQAVAAELPEALVAYNIRPGNLGPSRRSGGTAC